MTCGAESQPQACDVLRIKASGTALLPRLVEMDGAVCVVGGGGSLFNRAAPATMVSSPSSQDPGVLRASVGRCLKLSGSTLITSVVVWCSMPFFLIYSIFRTVLSSKQDGVEGQRFAICPLFPYALCLYMCIASPVINNPQQGWSICCN